MKLAYTVPRNFILEFNIRVTQTFHDTYVFMSIETKLTARQSPNNSVQRRNVSRALSRVPTCATLSNVELQSLFSRIPWAINPAKLTQNRSHKPPEQFRSAITSSSGNRLPKMGGRGGERMTILIKHKSRLATRSRSLIRQIRGGPFVECALLRINSCLSRHNNCPPYFTRL